MRCKSVLNNTIFTDMNILIAPDSFKECLSATEVANCIEKGIFDVLPEAKITKMPISDGGEGLLEALVLPLLGTIYSTTVLDPLLRPIKAEFGVLKDGTAIIEMAKASGLELLKEEEKIPLVTSSYGTGELIKAALDHGCTKIIIGLGGSATNDGGAGMARALGVTFLDKKGKILKDGGGNLKKLAKIDCSNIDKRLKDCEIIAACDVANPLTGPEGASYVYGGQKGS